MGGYYNEPNGSKDQSDTHMLFGVRCLEEQIDCNPNPPIVALRPIDEESNTPAISNQGVVSFLLSGKEDTAEEYGAPDLAEKVIVQIGTGGAALVMARYSGASKVIVLDKDETRLQILEHAHQVLNPSGPTYVACPLETRVVESTDDLPKADIIILDSDDEDWITVALEQTVPVLFASCY